MFFFKTHKAVQNGQLYVFNLARLIIVGDIIAKSQYRL